MVRDEPAERLVVLARLDVDVERLAHLLEWDARVHHRLALGDGQHERLLRVVFVADLADDLLDEVLERHDPRGAAVLVDDDGEVDFVALHLAQELVGFLRLRDEEHRADELSDVEVPFAAREALEQILHVDHADDLIERALVDGQP